MMLTPTQLSELWRKLHPGKAFRENFYPSLEGSEIQRLDALDCIVAAWENHYRKHPIMHNDHWVTLRGFPTTGGRTDILSAACAALLSQEGRG